MMNNYAARGSKIIYLLPLLIGAFLFSGKSASAQNLQSGNTVEALRSDVGINGLTANFHQLSDFTNLSDDTLQTDGSSELEFVFRDVRMLTPRLGAGFQVLTSFFVNDAKGQPGFGVGSWGIGPVLRAYPLKTTRFQPYVQANALFGNNLAVSTLADTQHDRDGFRVRLGLRGGVAWRFTNSFGFFVEGGSDWESSAFFKADAQAWQLNVGVDVYRFN